MRVHLEPTEFIQALEKASLSPRAAVHLRRCVECREVLRDLRGAWRALRASQDNEYAPNEAFWSEFTQTVHVAVRQMSTPADGSRPRRPAVPIRYSLVASVALLIVSILLASSSTRDLPPISSDEREAAAHHAMEPTRVESSETADGSMAIGFETLDAEQYVYTETRFYHQIRQELSFLDLGPETLTEADVGLSRYMDY